MQVLRQQYTVDTTFTVEILYYSRNGNCVGLVNCVGLFR